MLARTLQRYHLAFCPYKYRNDKPADTHSDSPMNVFPLHPSVSVLSSHPPAFPRLFDTHYVSERTTECYLCWQAISWRLRNRQANRRCISLLLSILSVLSIPCEADRFLLLSSAVTAPTALERRVAKGFTFPESFSLTGKGRFQGCGSFYPGKPL